MGSSQAASADPRPEPTIADRLAGGVWGHLLGDAAGLPYEGLPASAVPHRPLERAGPMRWSDDGALMLAQLDSLLTVGDNPDDFARRALAWYRDGAYTPDAIPGFGIGRTTHNALARIANGAPAQTAGGTDERDCGNGSLMRILPVALVGRAWSSDRLVDAAHRLSAVTHAHPRAQATCALYVLAAAHLIHDPAADDALDEAAGRLRQTYAGDRMAAYAAELDDVLRWPYRRGTGYVVDSFWTAWEACSAATSYPDAIGRAVRAGNDTDTTAAVCGGLAGLRWGRAGIPGDWLERLAGAAVAEPLVASLTARDAR